MNTWVNIILAIILYFAYRTYAYNVPISPSIPYIGGNNPFNRFKKLQEYAQDPIAFLQAQGKVYEAFCIDLLIWKWVFFVGPKGTMALATLKEEDASFFKYLPLVFGRQIQKVVDTPNNWFPTGAKSIRSGLLGPGRHEKIAPSISHIAEAHFQRWSQSPTGVPFFDSTSELAHTYGFYVMFGHNFADRYIKELLQIMSDFEEGPLDWRIRFVPWWMWNLFEGGRRTNGAIIGLNRLMKEEIQDIYSNRQKHSDRVDFLYYLTTVHDQKYTPAFGGLMLITLFAFWANLVPTMCWTVLHAYHAGMIERWRQEVLEAEEREGGEIPKMGGKPYMDACMRETGRLYSLLTVLRQTNRPTQVLNTLVPANTTIVCSPLASGQDSETYGEDVKEWKPERFLEEAEDKGKEEFKYQRWIKNCEFFQFGIGQHACPGEKLARFMMIDCYFKGLCKDWEIEFEGLEDGAGFSGVGVWPDWVGKNYGTPFQAGERVMIKLKKRG